MKAARAGETIRDSSQTPSSAPPTAVQIRGRNWIVLNVGFAVLAGAVLLLPAPALGWRILALVAAYNVLVVIVARRTDDRELWRAWTVLAPLSLLMVLPDWFLSDVLGTLAFPNTGGPFIGTVPLFMAGMWTIALLPVVLLALAVAARSGVSAGVMTAGLVGLGLFYVAELVAPSIPIWEPAGVQMTAGVATYVLLPELVLSASAFLVVWAARTVPATAVAWMVALLPFAYLGMLASSYQFLG